MSKAYPKLLSTLELNSKHVLKNRLVYPNASPHTLMGPESFPATGFRDFHVNLARNGAGIITIAEWNNPNQRKGPIDLDMTHMQMFDLTDPSVHNYFSLLAEEIHFYGSKIILNAKYELPEGYSMFGGMTAGPGVPPHMTKPLPKEMMPEVIEKFINKLKMYKMIGYDGVDLRADMDLLPPKGGDMRDDEYSAKTIEGRSRFLRELYAEIKKTFGDSFITEATVAWEQPWGYGPFMGVGISADEVAEYMHLAEKDVDIFQVREHDGCRSHPTGFNFKQGDHPAVEFCARMKAEGIKSLLQPIGGFQEPEEMEQYLAEGKCDMFGLARAFMADPDYGEKMRDGRSDEIIPCLKCNKCHGTIIPSDPDPWITMCSVNPRHGLQHELPRMIRETKPKKVAVIGGGATGMRAAIEAAKRGHDVTMFEKTGVLGGQLLHADYFDFKWPIKNYKEWLIRELDLCGVNVVMNTEPTPQEIEDAGFEAVFAATGALPVLPGSIEGLRDADGRALYKTTWETWGKEAELGKHVVIVGGSELGMETAIYLLRSGHKVTMLTRQNRLAHDASGLHYITMSFVKTDGPGEPYEASEWERYDEFTGIVNATTKKVEGNTVTYVDENGQEQTISGDDIIICGGTKKLIDEAMAYADCGKEFYPIGDCLGAGNLQRCNRQAFARASLI